MPQEDWDLNDGSLLTAIEDNIKKGIIEELEIEFPHNLHKLMDKYVYETMRSVFKNEGQVDIDYLTVRAHLSGNDIDDDIVKTVPLGKALSLNSQLFDCAGKVEIIKVLEAVLAETKLGLQDKRSCSCENQDCQYKPCYPPVAKVN